jgi:hypothetical protein
VWASRASVASQRCRCRHVREGREPGSLRAGWPAASRAAHDGLHAERGGATLRCGAVLRLSRDPRATIEQFGEKDLAEVGRCAAADGCQDRRTQGALLGHAPADVVGKILREGAPV